ncbi:MAG: malto-oligosyltrehalose synthase, partial [Myxococcota bacterium]
LELRAILARTLESDREAAGALAARLLRLNGSVGDRASFAELDRILAAQHFRLAFWRVAADEINYRRFFNVNELAGIRVERPAVFDRVHSLVSRLIDEGRLDGLRIDHIDGLFDPLAYCRSLRGRFGDRGVYLVVEKVLAPHEQLCRDWPVDGTTGYEFLNLVNGLFVDPAGEPSIAELYAEFTGADPGFDEVAYLAKKHVLNFLFGSELEMLAQDLDRLSEQDWRTRDFTRTSLREALKEVVALLPVYRTYLDAGGAGAEDRRFIEWAVERARKRSSDPEATLFDFVRAALTADLAAPGSGGYDPDAVLRFAMKFQQLTGPVAAKGVEDTAFYRYPRLLSLCEVGGDPRRFSSSVAAFHHVTRERAQHWPHALLATSTHDTKLGEDARTRVDALSELAEEWRAQLRRWSVLLQGNRRIIDDLPAPRPADELLLHQALVASWPAELVAPAALDAAAVHAFRERFEGYALKVVREAKLATSWRHPNTAYEEAVGAFVHAALDPDVERNRFLEELRAFQARAARIGAVSSLAQVLLKLTAPGVPDLYQGSELWDLSLVDPDNRRSVDFARRARALRELAARWRDGSGDPGELLASWSDGRAKLWLIWRLLELRRARPDLLRDGDYEPLEVVGPRAEHLCAFARRVPGAQLLVVAPRLVAKLLSAGTALELDPAALGDTCVLAPTGFEASEIREVTTGRRVALEATPEGRHALPAARAFARFPAGAFVALER